MSSPQSPGPGSARKADQVASESPSKRSRKDGGAVGRVMVASPPPPTPTPLRLMSSSSSSSSSHGPSMEDVEITDEEWSVSVDAMLKAEAFPEKAPTRLFTFDPNTPPPGLRKPGTIKCPASGPEEKRSLTLVLRDDSGVSVPPQFQADDAKSLVVISENENERNERDLLRDDAVQHWALTKGYPVARVVFVRTEDDERAFRVRLDVVRRQFQRNDVEIKLVALAPQPPPTPLTIALAASAVGAPGPASMPSRLLDWAWQLGRVGVVDHLTEMHVLPNGSWTRARQLQNANFAPDALADLLNTRTVVTQFPTVMPSLAPITTGLRYLLRWERREGANPFLALGVSQSEQPGGSKSAQSGGSKSAPDRDVMYRFLELNATNAALKLAHTKPSNSKGVVLVLTAKDDLFHASREEDYIKAGLDEDGPFESQGVSEDQVVASWSTLFKSGVVALHVASHFSEKDRAASVSLGTGKAKPFNFSVLGRSISDGHIKLDLVFLSMCQGRDVAQMLTSQRVPFVVYWESDVDDTAAAVFAREFWSSMAKSGSAIITEESVRKAFEDAREALFGRVHEMEGRHFAGKGRHIFVETAAPVLNLLAPNVIELRGGVPKLAMGRLPVVHPGWVMQLKLGPEFRTTQTSGTGDIDGDPGDGWIEACGVNKEEWTSVFQLSSIARTTLDDKAKKQAQFDDNNKFFCFAHPHPDIGSSVATFVRKKGSLDEALKVAAVPALVQGAFIYFHEHGDVNLVNAIDIYEDYRRSPRGKNKVPMRLKLMYGSRLKDEYVRLLFQQNRFVPVVQSRFPVRSSTTADVEASVRDLTPTDDALCVAWVDPTELLEVGRFHGSFVFARTSVVQPPRPASLTHSSATVAVAELSGIASSAPVEQHYFQVWGSKPL